MSQQRALFGAPVRSDRLPIAHLWDGQAVKKGDPERVDAVLRTFARKDPATATLGDLANLTAAVVKTQVPKRLMLILEQRLHDLGVPFAKVPRWPGRKLVTDLWSDEYRKRHGSQYGWDLHMTAHGSPWDSKDHSAAMAVVAGAAPMVLAPGVAFDDGVPREMEDWHSTAQERLVVAAEEARAELRVGQLIHRVGVRWEPWTQNLEEKYPEAVVVEQTDDGWVADRSQRAMVEAVLRRAMADYIHEAASNRDEARMAGFVRQFAVYMTGVLAQNGEALPRNVIAMPWKSGKRAAPSTLDAITDAEWDQAFDKISKKGRS